MKNGTGSKSLFNTAYQLATILPMICLLPSLHDVTLLSAPSPKHWLQLPSYKKPTKYAEINGRMVQISWL